MIKKTIIETKENDVYFLEVVDDKIIINDNYEGILIFDIEGILIKRIALMNGMIIHSALKNDKELVLLCNENGIIFHIDLETYQYKMILMGDFEDWIFSPIFEWRKNEVILSDYKGNLLKLDLRQKRLIKTSKNSHEYDLVRKTYEKLNDYHIAKMISEEKAIVQNSCSELELIDYSEDVITILKFQKEQFHDFEVADNHIICVGENEIEIMDINNKENKRFLPGKGYCFLRGKCIIREGQVLAFLLCGNKSNQYHAKIGKYVLESKR